MIAEEVLFGSEGCYGSSTTHELGRNSSTNYQERREGPQRQGGGPYACEICPKIYSKQHSLNRHMKWHTKPLTCPSEGCDWRCAEKKDLGRHVGTYHSSQKPRFKCDRCGEDFARREYLTRHQIHRKKPCTR
ncbi:hypothetical protein LY78DRAFT_664050 [Colletotrichum sublineola]|nr:hypothetical protein LY78DRAFT_664050 [Colletotrichum sublineola]